MHPDMLDVIFSVNSFNADSDKGLTWVSTLHLSISPVAPYIVEKHVAHSSRVLEKTGLHYPEQSVLCGNTVVGKTDGWVPDFNAIEEIIDTVHKPSTKYCMACLKQASFLSVVYS